MFPVLRRCGLPMMLFIYPSAISNASYAMTWDQLREMARSGLVDVQSYSYWHPDFKRERERLMPVFWVKPDHGPHRFERDHQIPGRGYGPSSHRGVLGRAAIHVPRTARALSPILTAQSLQAAQLGQNPRKGRGLAAFVPSSVGGGKRSARSPKIARATASGSIPGSRCTLS